jgi:hypothetical protein
MSGKSVYLDACCFIELALDQNGGKLAAGGKYVEPIKSLLRAARDKKIVVVTSQISIAECTHADGNIDADTQRIFRALLTSGTSGVLPWQADVFVLERARDLRWKHSINLSALDGIHVATAIESSCDELITWDGESSKRKSILKAAASIDRLGCRIVLPTSTTSIPDEYKQQTLTLVQTGPVAATKKGG